MSHSSLCECGSTDRVAIHIRSLRVGCMLDARNVLVRLFRVSITGFATFLEQSCLQGNILFDSVRKGGMIAMYKLGINRSRYRVLPVLAALLSLLSSDFIATQIF